MEFDFQQWLFEAFKEGSLTKDEIDECLSDNIKSYYLFVEYLESDRIGTGEYARDELYKFKVKQARSLR